MLERRLGSGGARVSQLALGSWHVYDRMRFEDAVEMVAAAAEAGINLFDVGVYGGPEGPGSFTDIIFSRVVQAAGLRRSEYVLAAKLWLNDYPDVVLSTQLDRALLRMGTDYADVGMLGDIADETLDLSRLVDDVGELVAAGKLRAWGITNWSAANLREAHELAEAAGLPKPSLAQLKYSVARR